jgi:glutaredoxin
MRDFLREKIRSTTLLHPPHLFPHRSTKTKNTMNPSILSAACWALILTCVNGFAPSHTPLTTRSLRTLQSTRPITTLASSTNYAETSIASVVDSITAGYERFQKAKGEGYNFKQSVAIALAGEYDEESVKTKIQTEIDSAPVVMFTWEASPACKNAIKYLDIAGASYKIVRLDNPWSEGNPIRAELGKRVGRSSVPCIFIGGEYVGGFDAGVGSDSPGLMEMAFKGTLRDRLGEVGALGDSVGP